MLTLCFFLSSHHCNILQPTSGPSRSPSKALTPLEAATEAIYAIKTITITDISVPAKKSLAKILVGLDEDPPDLAGAIKNAKKALKKFKCPGDPEDDAAVQACEAIDEAIKLLEQAYKPFFV